MSRDKKLGGDRNRFSDGKQAEKIEDLYNVLTEKLDKSIPRGFSDDELIKKVEDDLEKVKDKYMQGSQDLYQLAKIMRRGGKDSDEDG